MPFLFSYLLKFSISLAVMYTFYQLVLRPLTFYQWNRFFLLGYSLLCFVIPFINIAGWIQQPGASPARIITIIPALGQYAPAVPVTTAHAAPGIVAAAQAAAPAYGLYYWLTLALTAGTAIMLGRLVLLYASLWRMKRRAVLLSGDAQMQLFETDMAVSPFSFGRAVYFNPARHTEEELEQIIRHEYVHVKQRHTVDLLLGELLCLVNWYNPFAWMVRYSMRQNLEFIADNNVIENGIDKKEYQYLLLKVVGISQYRIANNFNFSNLKKRIAMMNKMKSARLHLGRFLFVLPLLAVLLLAFRGKYAGQTANAKFFITSGIVLDITTKKPISGARVIETTTASTATTDNRGFYRLSIPVVTGDHSYKYSAQSDGYHETQSGFSFGKDRSQSGHIEIFGLQGLKDPDPKGAFMMSFSDAFMNGPTVSDPSYDDAFKACQQYLDQLKNFSRYAEMRNDHPEVSLFYSSEDKKGQIVFFKAGGFEKYGYPGTPSIADMEKKYGELPGWSKVNETPRTYYNKQWKEISEKLEKTFVPATGHEFKNIVFPGDSRVLVQFAGGKVEIYDMDYDKERNAFESLFGKLQAAPPPSRTDNARLSVPAAATPPPAPASGAFVPAASPAEKVEGIRGNPVEGFTPLTVAVKPGDTSKPHNPLFVLIDGDSWKECNSLESIPADNIAIINVLKNATGKYGDRGKYGVVEITLKTKEQKAIDAIPMKPGGITWSASAKVLSLCGEIYLKTRDREYKMDASPVHFIPAEPAIALNGRLLDMSRDYANAGFGSGAYTMQGLNKQEAQQKYGIGSDRVLEINSK